MKKGKFATVIGSGIIGTAIIWGAVIIGCSLKLKGTGGYDEIQNILALGTIMNIIIWGGVSGGLFSMNKSESENAKL